MSSVSSQLIFLQLAVNVPQHVEIWGRTECCIWRRMKTSSWKHLAAAQVN